MQPRLHPDLRKAEPLLTCALNTERAVDMLASLYRHEQPGAMQHGKQPVHDGARHLRVGGGADALARDFARRAADDAQRTGRRRGGGEQQARGFGCLLMNDVQIQFHNQ